MINRFVLLVGIIASLQCTGCKHESTLTIKDLKFPDPEKNAIVKNHIRAISGFDTTWCSAAPKTIFWSQIRESISLDSLLKLGTERFEFDASGNRTYYRRSSGDSYCGTYSANTVFAFDSLGFTVHASPYQDDSISYLFDNKTNRLLSIHHIVRGLWANTRAWVDTVTSFFDTSGRLNIAVENNPLFPDTTFYSYDTAGALSFKKTNRFRPGKENDYNEPYEVTTRCYYKSDLLDSV